MPPRCEENTRPGYGRCEEGPRYGIERSAWGGSLPRAHRNGQLEQNPALGPRGQVGDPVREEPGEEEIGGPLRPAWPWLPLPRGIGGPGDRECLALGRAGPGCPLERPAGAGARPGPPQDRLSRERLAGLGLPPAPPTEGPTGAGAQSEAPRSNGSPGEWWGRDEGGSAVPGKTG
ncbi:hypothetical protein NDU88_003169 [Pleurodeles waltl]|uniref:Uncharacterized protein n=1 Tax=Pleurodeles waltl TaxID=8319 RepID=A0AAV7TQE8_PLEWA|nr:hypothetical protein NDU88_003169 [Pleurodeles waltl]